MHNETLNSIIITLATTDLTEDGNAYAVTHVYRYDFKGDALDWEAVVTQFPELFIEGGSMHNWE